MKGNEFEEFLCVRPKPGSLLNVSRQVPSPANQACHYLQKVLHRRRGKALSSTDVVELTGVVLLVVISADIVCTLCLEKRKHTKEQRRYSSIWNRSHDLTGVIASYMVQITWPTSVLEAVRNAELYGIAGNKFVPANSALIHSIFVLLLLEFRTKAPGAQTIAQFVGHRFGLVAHILTTTISLLTVLYTLTVNITEGSMVLNAVTRNVGEAAIVSVVLILVVALLVVARRRSYGLILYIINAHILLVCAILVFTLLNVSTSPALGNIDSFYKLLMCYNKSDHRIGSTMIGGLDDGILSDSITSLIHHVVRVLLDQALWQVSINLSPNHAVLGLLLASIMAVCVPFALSVVCGLGFRALESAFSNAALLNETQRTYGLVMFATPMHLMGKTGIWVIFIVILLLLVTSCAFSIVGASSVLYHDVLLTYIRVSLSQITCLAILGTATKVYAERSMLY
ncbi:Urea-proton symporter DUR3 [Taenia crassiceps]|uniref:Urea-proton symporter DUR3 n=1 Tax=Taenia crassiceps TaxID=6207 RepID=A0ABR4Q5H8_9CEST